MILFIQGGQITDTIRNPTVSDFPIRGLDKTKLIDPGVAGKRRYQTDVGAFWSFDGTDTTIMGRVDVPYFKPRPFPRETSGPQGGKTPLVSDLRKGIGLIQKLRELTGPEEFLQGGGHGLVVDKLLRHQGIDILKTHLFLDGPLHSNQSHAEMVLHQLSHGAYPPVAQVIDVVHEPVAVSQFDEVSNHFENIFFAERALLQRYIELKPVIEL